MKAEQIEAIRKRSEEATKGPWHKGEYWTGESSVIGAPEFPINVCVTLMEKDAEFIANAHEDIPALLAEVERLKAQVSESNSLLGMALDKMDNAHLFDTDAFRNISRYLYGEDDE